jgi:hypothetical protein
MTQHHLNPQESTKMHGFEQTFSFEIQYLIFKVILNVIVPEYSQHFTERSHSLTNGLTSAVTAEKRPYLLSPRSRVLLEKLIGTQLVKKFPTFYGNRRFITAFTSAL